MFHRNANVMVKRLLLLLALGSCFTVEAQLLPNYGEERAGLSSFTFLKSPIDPWSAGLGGTSLSNKSAYALATNPALLTAGNQQGLLSGSRYLGASIGHDFVSVSKARNANQTIGVSVNSLYSGGIMERTVWQPEGTGRIVNGALTTVGLGVAQRFSDYFNAGIQLKYGQEQLGAFVAHSVAVDLGFHYELDYRELTFAAAILNFGPSTPIIQSGILPTTVNTDTTASSVAAPPQVFSMGMRFIAWEEGKHKVYSSFQLNHPSDNNENYSIATEYLFMNLFEVQLGYRFVSKWGAPSFGFSTKTNLGGWPMKMGVSAIPSPAGGYQTVIGLRITPLTWLQ